jgi:hypothetical protein
VAKTIPKVHHLDRWAAELGDSIAAGDPDCLLRTEDIAKVMRVSEAWLEIGRSKGWARRTSG